MHILKLFLTTVALGVSLLAGAQQNCLVVKAGDAENLLSTLDQANKQNADPQAERLFVMIPDGVYDLGERSLTPILGHNIALVGQSTDGTVIVNAPKVENEGISKTATLLNRGQNTYVQDLTLKNALDYYHSGAAGRAVCWQDKGNRTIFKRVRMLSYQDTYYSHSEVCQHYFEDSEIHGTIDFICGAGDVFFSRCRIVVEPREVNGQGRDVIVAPRTSVTQWGYVFDHCTIDGSAAAYHYGRGWHTLPRMALLHTTLTNPEKLMATRYDSEGMRTVESLFYEYHTMDASGRDITPKTNVVTFECKGETRKHETILSDEDARRFQIEKIFPDWRPEKITSKLIRQAEAMKSAVFR